MNRSAHSRYRSIPIFLLFAASICIACQERTARPVDSRVPEDVLKRSRERLLGEIKEEQAAHARLRRVGPGSSASAVLAEFGKPASTTPCAGAATCWYYDIGQQKYFICFNTSNVVVCNGQASALNPTHYMPRPN